MGTEAASWNVQSSGMRTTMRASAADVSANESGSSPITRSPTAVPVTPGPTSVTTPAPSPPIDAAPGYMPSEMSTSRKLRPAARTATRTRPSPSGSSAFEGWGTRASSADVPPDPGVRSQWPWGGAVKSPPSPAASRRGVDSVPLRRTSWGSGAAERADSTAGHSSSPTSVSTSSRTSRSGCSDCAERTSPHTPAADTSTPRSLSSAATAPRVRTTSLRPAISGAARKACTWPSTHTVRTRARSGTVPSSGARQGSTTQCGSAAPARTAAEAATMSGTACT
ncbi:hypothetical protein Sgri01_07170 [Streptomyces griseus]